MYYLLYDGPLIDDFRKPGLKKSLKIPKRKPDAVNRRRTYNVMDD
jgi:hypothetical protein